MSLINNLSQHQVAEMLLPQILSLQSVASVFISSEGRARGGLASTSPVWLWQDQFHQCWWHKAFIPHWLLASDLLSSQPHTLVPAPSERGENNIEKSHLLSVTSSCKLTLTKPCFEKQAERCCHYSGRGPH